MKAVVRYKVTKEKEIEYDENTFNSNESIEAFWEKLLQQERASKIEGIWIKDSNGNKICK